MEREWSQEWNRILPTPFFSRYLFFLFLLFTLYFFYPLFSISVLYSLSLPISLSLALSLSGSLLERLLPFKEALLPLETIFLDTLRTCLFLSYPASKCNLFQHEISSRVTFISIRMTVSEKNKNSFIPARKEVMKRRYGFYRQ